MRATTPKSVLISWIGSTDLRASRGEEVGQGPVAQAVLNRDYDLIVLLSNYAKAEVGPYLKWLKDKKQSAVECRYAELSSPTHFGEIYEFVTDQIASIQKSHGMDTRLTYHLSPGTPAMAAVWIIIAKTRHAAELIESSREHGVRTAVVPFDISAEFIPGLLKHPDSNLSRLTAGNPESEPAFSEVIHRSQAMERVIAKARMVAPRSVPVLIEGESGTGKELISRAIHFAGPRHENPFIAVNCGAISPELAESEFFGHKKGAFTGANEARRGHFREADGGTLFLDEIGELPLDLQVKLLRAIQEGQVTPVGESRPASVNVRLICATNRNLSKEVADGRFRGDLYYRIAVAVIRMPPLRERKGDLSLLIDHLLAKINRESTAEPAWEPKKLTAAGRNLLLQHHWPGNIRELQNTLTRAAVWSSGATLTAEDIHEALLEAPHQLESKETVLGRAVAQGIDLPGLLSEVARHYLLEATKEAHGNKTKAAKLIGLSSYQTFNNWLQKYGLSP